MLVTAPIKAAYDGGAQGGVLGAAAGFGVGLGLGRQYCLYSSGGG